ncbi:MAG TPA: VanZ family protein [Saprospiraceae bacterium]|nr:VanZ family protein [Saprospiraceae bacterium]HPI05519.1 VanZ family protein [Saprospiraceae bacterium]
MIKAYWPAFVWLLVITGLSVMPGVQLPSFQLFAMDKLAHAFVYGVLTWLLLRANMRTNRWNELVIFCISTSYGVLMEFVQYAFIPGRFYEIDDMLANAFGCIIGWLCFRIALKTNIISQA